MSDLVDPADVTQRLGYRLKRATSALRAAMDATLRPHGLTVPQYACLEQLDQRPELSNAELARAVFVTRQSMNVVLRGLIDAGLVARPSTADHGRARPARLTDEGRRRLDAARDAVYAVDRRLAGAVPDERLADLLDDLDRMARAVSADPTPAGTP
jgi:DNA-binding MarR family transcriptional regulator